MTGVCECDGGWCDRLKEGHEFERRRGISLLHDFEQRPNLPRNLFFFLFPTPLHCPSIEWDAIYSKQ